MPKSSNQKIKILYIMQLLLERTDEEHPASTSDIITYLSSYGISAERKSIYDDMEVLKLWGMDILYRKERPSGYYLASRDFELPELKLLVDAVMSAKFITEKKSRELIKKLEKLTNHNDAVQLQRQVVVSNRIKAINEKIYYNVDNIHEAILQNKKISFKYFEWNLKKEMQFRKNGSIYIINPIALCWDDENYYMICYDNDSDIIKHYRVDKMVDVKCTDEARCISDSSRNIDLGKYACKTFGMFGGDDAHVRLKCRNNAVGIVLDRFGKDIMIVPVDDEFFTIVVEVTVSKQFFGWITSVGDCISIAGPDGIRNRYKEYLQDILSAMED